MIASLAPLWLSDPAWCAMDPTARGFHTHLVLLAARQGGEISDDESQWRQWLGIAPAAPSGQSVTSAVVLAGLESPTLSRTELLGSQQHLLERLWEERWLPMVRQAWKPTRKGFLTCDAAQALASGEPKTASTVAAPVPAAPNRKRVKRKAPVNVSMLPLEQILGAIGPIGEGQRVLRPLSERLMDPAQALVLWHLPVSRAQRLSVWSVGLAVLTRAPGEESANRSFLATLIRQYGERKVSAAVGELSGRSTQPADPRSFLRSLLRRDTEGTPGAQQARERRANIPL